MGKTTSRFPNVLCCYRVHLNKQSSTDMYNFHRIICRNNELLFEYKLINYLTSTCIVL